LLQKLLQIIPSKYIRHFYPGQRELVLFCPWCWERDRKRKYKIYLNIDTLYWHCWRCGKSGNASTLHTLFRKYDIGRFNLNVKHETFHETRKEKKKKRKINWDKFKEKYEKKNSLYLTAISYLTERGYSWHKLRELTNAIICSDGNSPYYGTIIYPYFLGTGCLCDNFLTRQPKYLSFKVEEDDDLVLLPGKFSECFLVEGIYDGIRLKEVTEGAVIVMGGKNVGKAVKFLEKVEVAPNTITLALDADVPEIEKRKKLPQLVQYAEKVYDCVVPEGDLDSAHNITELVKSKVLFNEFYKVAYHEKIYQKIQRL